MYGGAEQLGNMERCSHPQKLRGITFREMMIGSEVDSFSDWAEKSLTDSMSRCMMKCDDPIRTAACISAISACS